MTKCQVCKGARVIIATTRYDGDLIDEAYRLASLLEYDRGPMPIVHEGLRLDPCPACNFETQYTLKRLGCWRSALQGLIAGRCQRPEKITPMERRGLSLEARELGDELWRLWQIDNCPPGATVGEE